MTFLAALCSERGCSIDVGASLLFRLGLYPRARLLLPVVWKWRPQYFAEDLRLISEIGQATNREEARIAVSRYRQACAWNRRFVHDALRVRVSGHRLLRLFGDTMPLAQEEAKPVSAS